MHGLVSLAGGHVRNMRADLDLILDHERHILAEDQKACRARTRKFSLETNRRRKALEERRREEDVREQRLREEILQQRRHMVQEATERFQRAHLPPSQRRRPASRRTPHLEEALNQIQGSSSSSSLQSTFLRSPGSNSSPGSRYQKQLSAAVAYAKLVQERSGAALKSSQLLFHSELQGKQRLLEERQIDSLQDFQREVSNVGRSESLSSLDSLENEVPHHKPAVSLGFMSSSSSEKSEVLNCTRPQSPRKHFSGHNNLLWQESGVFTGSCSPTQDTEQLGEYDKITLSRGEPIIDDQNPPPAPSYQSTFTQRGILDNTYQNKTDLQNCTCEKAPAHSHEATSTQRAVGGVVLPACPDETEKAPAGMPLKAWGIPDFMPPESSRPAQEDIYGPARTQGDRFLNRTEATQVVLPSGLFSDREVSESTSAVQSARSQKSEDQEASVPKAIERLSHLHKTHLASNSCEKDADGETGSTQTRPSNPCDLTPKISHVKVSRGHEQDLQTRLDLASASSSASRSDDTKSVRGILKKESKYATSCHTKSTFFPADSVPTNNFWVSVRDSVEVVKQRERDAEVGKGVKKKLRWFDEVCFHEEAGESRPLPDEQEPSKPPQGKIISTGHQEGPGLASSLGKTTPAPQVVTPVTPSGHHVMKQAWGYERGPERSRGEEARAERGAPRRGRPRVPRRVRSARARPGLAPPRIRKGVAVRPQSASEASQVRKASQGRIIMPHPPPKSTSPESHPTLDSSAVEEGRAPSATKSVFNVTHGSSRMGPTAEPRDLSEGHALPLGTSTLTTTGGVAFTPFPPSYTLSTYETINKATYAMTNDQQEALGAAGRRGPMYVEYGLSLGQTPTDEEISRLWHGVRSALGPKDGEPQSAPAYNGLLSGLPHTRANLSHVTIDGGSLIGGIKGVTRMGGFFVTTSNATKSMVRRKQSADGMGTKHRALLEQRRVNSGSGIRRPALPSQTTVQISPLSGKADQLTGQLTGVALQDEVSESTAQFLLAENLADSSATDDDILAAMETAHVQLQQQGRLQQRPLSLGQNMSALSLEEQKLLLSLDRLDHRLQGVQEAAAGNASVPSMLQVHTQANLLSRLGEGQAVGQRCYRGSSADGRSGLERRY